MLQLLHRSANTNVALKQDFQDCVMDNAHVAIPRKL
jgi:hypothetical protein